MKTAARRPSVIRLSRYVLEDIILTLGPDGTEDLSNLRGKYTPVKSSKFVIIESAKEICFSKTH